MQDHRTVLPDPKLNFPQPITINGRNFYAVRQIERWKRDRAARAASSVAAGALRNRVARPAELTKHAGLADGARSIATAPEGPAILTRIGSCENDGHGAMSVARVAQRVCVRREKYPAS